MPSTTPEYLARKAEQRNKRRRAAREEARKEIAKHQDLTLPSHRITARKLMPRIPEMSKAELRAMLEQAFANTAAL